MTPQDNPLPPVPRTQPFLLRRLGQSVSPAFSPRITQPPVPLTTQDDPVHPRNPLAYYQNDEPVFPTLIPPVLPPAAPTFVPPARIQSDPSSRHLEILGLPPQPFLPENIYLAATIPTRDLIEHFTFVNHCRYILQNRVERQVNHSLTELHRLTPHPIIFAGFLWHYRIIINQTGILEDYRRIV